MINLKKIKEIEQIEHPNKTWTQAGLTNNTIIYKEENEQILGSTLRSEFEIAHIFKEKNNSIETKFTAKLICPCKENEFFVIKVEYPYNDLKNLNKISSDDFLNKVIFLDEIELKDFNKDNYFGEDVDEFDVKDYANNKELISIIKETTNIDTKNIFKTTLANYYNNHKETIEKHYDKYKQVLEKCLDAKDVIENYYKTKEDVLYKLEEKFNFNYSEDDTCKGARIYDCWCKFNTNGIKAEINDDGKVIVYPKEYSLISKTEGFDLCKLDGYYTDKDGHEFPNIGYSDINYDADEGYDSEDKPLKSYKEISNKYKDLVEISDIDFDNDNVEMD